jgi:hypothetical protein
MNNPGNELARKFYVGRWRRCAALSMSPGRFGGGILQKRFKKKYVRSRYVYENKQL